MPRESGLKRWCPSLQKFIIVRRHASFAAQCPPLLTGATRFLPLGRPTVRRRLRRRGLGALPGLIGDPIARGTRGSIPGLWDPRRVNDPWPEPVDNALVAYVPGLGQAVSTIHTSAVSPAWPATPGYFGPYRENLSGLGHDAPCTRGADCNSGACVNGSCLGDDYPLDRQTSLLPGWWRVFATLGAVQGAYHGYKRNQSAGWAFGWFLLGGIVPFFTIPLSIAQGFPSYKK